MTMRGIAMLVAFVGCADPPTATGDDPASALVVSEPVAPPARAALGRAAPAAAASVSYVSLPPGAVPGGVSARVHNRATGASLTTVVTDGGFDPVAIVTSVGDELVIEVRGLTAVIASLSVKVPPRQPPKVVRISPPKGKTDVPLNARITVVFSEPIDAATVGAATLRLSANAQQVAATIQVDPTGLTAELVPQSPLAPSTEYALTVTTGVRDLGGDALETTETAEFTTGTSPGGSLRVTTATSGPEPDPDGYSVGIDGEPPQPLGVNASVTIAGLPEGTHVVTLSGVAANCLVGGSNPQAVEVPAGGTASVDFAVTCASRVGSIRVTTTTAGQELDPSGYVAEFRTGSGTVITSEPVGVNSSITIPAIPVGGNAVTLAGVAPQCKVAGTMPRAVEVVEGATADVAFEIACGAAPRIAFVSAGPENWDIFVVHAGGVGVTRLTSHSALDTDPAWSPDGKRIAFASDRAGRPGEYDIYIMDADGSNVVRRTSSGAPNHKPTWSPDGRRIAFVSERDGDSDIYVMGADDGSSPIRITSDAGYDSYPAWSPDGTRIAFASSRGGTLDVYVMGPDGTGVTRVTSGIPNLLDHFAPAWSPDGGRIAVVTIECKDTSDCWESSEFSVRVMNLDGSGVTTLASGIRFIGARPAWSPDGRAVVFAPEACSFSCTFSVVSVSVDGSGSSLIASDAHSPAWRW